MITLKDIVPKFMKAFGKRLKVTGKSEQVQVNIHKI